MTTFEETQFEGFDQGNGLPPAPPPPPRNRNFIIAVGVIGGIFVLALIALIAYVVLQGPQANAERNSQAQSIYATNTAIVMLATEKERQLQVERTNQAATKAALPTSTQPAVATITPVLAFTKTPIPTNTKGAAPTNTVSANDQARTQTLQALLLTTTAQGTGYPGPAKSGTPQATATGLPQTGFADEVGLPGLVGLAFVLLVVIFVARRFRMSAH